MATRSGHDEAASHRIDEHPRYVLCYFRVMSTSDAKSAPSLAAGNIVD